MSTIIVVVVVVVGDSEGEVGKGRGNVVSECMDAIDYVTRIGNILVAIFFAEFCARFQLLSPKESVG